MKVEFLYLSHLQLPCVWPVPFMAINLKMISWKLKGLEMKYYTIAKHTLVTSPSLRFIFNKFLYAIWGVGWVPKLVAMGVGPTN